MSARFDQPLFVEFKDSSMHVLDGERGLDIPLERDAAGRLTAGSISEASIRLQAFFHEHGAMGPRIANCSIPARGVSVRRMSVPAAAKEDVEQLLTLQMEAQLPVPPSELAFGSARVGGNGAEMQEFLVVAVKRELLSDYTRVLADAGVAAHYTLSALARQELCPRTAHEFSVLEVNGTRAELAKFDDRGMAAIRVVPAKGSLTGLGKKLYLTGAGQLEAVGQELSQRLPADTSLELLNGIAGPGQTPANLGLKRLIESGGKPLFLGGRESAPQRAGGGIKYKWAVLAGVLAAGVLLLRYVDSMIQRGRLERKLEAIATHRATLPKIDREFNFLNYIKTNQPPHLDTLTVLAASAPAGARVESVSIGRTGDLSIRGSVGDAEAPGKFRSRLIESGFFARVVLEEQSSSSDAQKVNFRMSAQIRPEGSRKPLILSEPPKAKTTNEAQAKSS